MPGGALAGRVALVTGSSSGIGRAIARRFAAEGATVVCTDVREEPVEGGEPTHRELGATYLPCDLADAAAVQRLVPDAVAAHGRLDVLVANAATYVSEGLAGTTAAQWDLVQAVNVRAPFLLCRAAVAQFLAQPAPDGEVRGRIVVVGSQHGVVTAPGDLAYGVSKAAVMHLARSVATEHAPDWVVCNTVAPGKIVTGKGGREDDPAFQEQWRSRTPWPRAGHPDDVAAAALFLASDAASFTTGATLMVDGGWSAS